MLSIFLGMEEDKAFFILAILQFPCSESLSCMQDVLSAHSTPKVTVGSR
jgi:hypothetical protein